MNLLAASLVMATWKYFVKDKQATLLLSAVMTGISFQSNSEITVVTRNRVTYLNGNGLMHRVLIASVLAAPAAKGVK